MKVIKSSFEVSPKVSLSETPLNVSFARHSVYRNSAPGVSNGDASLVRDLCVVRGEPVLCNLKGNHTQRTGIPMPRDSRLRINSAFSLFVSEMGFACISISTALFPGFTRWLVVVASLLLAILTLVIFLSLSVSLSVSVPSLSRLIYFISHSTRN